MPGERVDLRGAKATLLMTLYLRELDAQSAQPILGDRYASDIMSRIDYDFGRLRRFRSDGNTIACRAQQLDSWAREFLIKHPDGQVLHLGCGLDSRPLRIERPASSRWIDVDYPDVIDLRRRLYDLPADVVCVPSSVTQPGWWDEVAPDRPTLMLAEGLFMYLTGEDVHAVVDRAVRTFAVGQLAFDGVAPWTVPVSNRAREMRAAGARFHWAYRKRAFETRHPTLLCRDDISVLRLMAEVANRPLSRLIHRIVSRIPPLANSMRLHRYSFTR